MSEEFINNSRTTETASTPNEWQVECQCQCQGSPHVPNGPDCKGISRWLNFYWFEMAANLSEPTTNEGSGSGDESEDESEDEEERVEETMALLMSDLSHICPLTTASVERIFGIPALGLAGTHLFAPPRKTTREAQIHPDNNRSYLTKYIEFGYPATAYLHDLYQLKNSTSSVKHWGNPAYQNVFSDILRGITNWACHLQQLPAEDLYHAFSTNINANPHIRMCDLPFNKRYDQGSEIYKFLSGPAWNCSLEYLIKVSFGLRYLHDFSVSAGVESPLSSAYRRANETLLELLMKIKNGHERIRQARIDAILAEVPQMPQVIGSLLIEFSGEKNDSEHKKFMNKIELATAFLTNIINLPAASDEVSAHPAPEPEPSASPTPPQ